MSKFEDAVRRSCLEWACALPDGTEYTLSENSESYLKKLIKRMEHGSYYRISKKTLRFILIAALIAALCTAVTIGANIGEQDFEIIPNGDMAQYKVIEPNSPIFKSDLEVRYIIPGFEVSEKMYDMDNNLVGYEYSMQDDSISYTVDRSDAYSSVYIDSEHGLETVERDNITYVCYGMVDGFSALIWNYGGYIYTVSGNLSLSDAFAVADSINH